MYRKSTLLVYIALLAGALGAWLPGARAQAPAGWSVTEKISRGDEIASSPVLAADVSGVVHAFWESRPREQEDAVFAIVYSRLRDGEWSAPVDVALSPDGRDARFPRAVVDAAGRLHLFWWSPGQGTFGPLYHSWAPAGSAADAHQWQPARVLADGTFQADVRLDSGGRLHVVYASVLDGKGICHVVSDDYGDTWSEPSCFPQNYLRRDQEREVRPRLAVDSHDTLHAVWILDDYSSDSKLSYSGRAVYYARSSDGGITWSDPLMVDEIDGRSPTYDRQIDGLQPEWGNITVDGTDRVHIVWVGRPDMYRYHQWSSDGGLTWSPPQVAIASGGYNNWQGLAVDDNNRLHLLWPSLKGMEYTWWDGSAWSPPVLLSEGGYAHHAQAVVALGNQLHVVWQDHGGGALADDQLGYIRYATLDTGAPAREPVPVPTMAVSAQSVPTEEQPGTPSGTGQPTPQPTPVSLSQSAPPGQGSSISPFVVGVIPVLALIGIVLLSRLRKR